MRVLLQVVALHLQNALFQQTKKRLPTAVTKGGQGTSRGQRGKDHLIADRIVGKIEKLVLHVKSRRGIDELLIILELMKE